MPDGWAISSRGSRVDSTKTKEYKELLKDQYMETANKRIVPLIIVSKHDAFFDEEDNPLIEVSVERKSLLKGVKTSKDYLDFRKKILSKRKGLKFSEYSTGKIGNKKFDMMTIDIADGKWV